MTNVLIYHFFHPFLCTRNIPMFTASEVAFYRCSDDTRVAATILGPGAQSDTVQIEYCLLPSGQFRL